jgi:hypothetical protein
MSPCLGRDPRLQHHLVLFMYSITHIHILIPYQQGRLVAIVVVFLLLKLAMRLKSRSASCCLSNRTRNTNSSKRFVMDLLNVSTEICPDCKQETSVGRSQRKDGTCSLPSVVEVTRCLMPVHCPTICCYIVFRTSSSYQSYSSITISK